MKLSIIGFGHMGSAIIAGAIKSGILSAKDVTAADMNAGNLARAAAMGIHTASDNKDAVKNADVVILAVKPSDLSELAKQIRGELDPSALLVSICAGKRLEALCEMFGKDSKIVRVMPNTPALVGEGMAALCASGNVTEGELAEVRRIFESFGRAEVLDEALFDTVTAVSGSGPAYVYSFIDALAGYASERGMSAEQAKLFAAQTVLGAAKMTLSSEDTPQKLKQSVCSPGGTTIEAVKVLDDRGFEQIIKDAARACEEKSRILAK